MRNYSILVLFERIKQNPNKSAYFRSLDGNKCKFEMKRKRKWETVKTKDQQWQTIRLKFPFKHFASRWEHLSDDATRNNRIQARYRLDQICKSHFSSLSIRSFVHVRNVLCICFLCCQRKISIGRNLLTSNFVERHGMSWPIHHSPVHESMYAELIDLTIRSNT